MNLYLGSSGGGGGGGGWWSPSNRKKEIWNHILWSSSDFFRKDWKVFYGKVRQFIPIAFRKAKIVYNCSLSEYHAKTIHHKLDLKHQDYYHFHHYCLQFPHHYNKHMVTKELHLCKILSLLFFNISPQFKFFLDIFIIWLYSMVFVSYLRLF